MTPKILDSRTLYKTVLLVAILLVLSFFLMQSSTSAKDSPIKVAVSLDLTGKSGRLGKSALYAIRLWVNDVNQRGGLLGRKLELIYRDNQSNPEKTKSDYEQFITIDKVDLLLGPNGANAMDQAIPVAKKFNKVLPGLMSLDSNRDFDYRYYFQINPFGPNPYKLWSEGFFQIAKGLNSKQATVALLGDSEDYGRNALEGAAFNANFFGFRVVYRQFYTSRGQIRHALEEIKESRADVVYIASRASDAETIILLIHELRLKPKLLGGGIIGLQSPGIQQKLGPLLNGIVTFAYGTPDFYSRFAGAEAFLKQYRAQIATENVSGIDSTGIFTAPYAYAYGQLLEEAVNATGSLDHAKLGEYIISHEHHLIVGNVRFAPNGEWQKSRILQVQYQNVRGHDLDQFIRSDKPVATILYPIEFATGQLLSPLPEVPD